MASRLLCRVFRKPSSRFIVQQRSSSLETHHLLKRDLRSARSFSSSSRNEHRQNSNNGQHSSSSAYFQANSGDQGRRRLILLAISVGSLVVWLLASSSDAKAEEKEGSGKKKKRIVILGTGWGGLSVLQDVNTDLYEVIVVSPTNYHLFTPLLPSAAVGTVDYRSIAEPIRVFSLRKKLKCQFYEASCEDIDFEKNVVLCEDISKMKGSNPQFSLPYDYLVVAIGSKTNTFNTPGVTEHSFFLKTIEDAQRIRERILDCFETADLPSVPEEEKKKLLHFLVVGGGPTGVEFCAELRDYFVSDLARHYPNIAKYVKFSLVQSGDHLLNTYASSISNYTEKKFRRDDINVYINTRVTEVRDGAVELFEKASKKKSTVPCGLIVWSTGISAPPLLSKVTAKLQQQQHEKTLLTDGFLRVLGTQNVFAIGDCANVHEPRLLEHFEELFNEADKDKSGTLSFQEFQQLIRAHAPKYRQLAEYGAHIEVMFQEADKNKDNVLSLDELKTFVKKLDSQLTAFPQTAQVAAQEGKYLASYFNSIAKNNSPETPFKYHHAGSLAYVGDSRSVADLGSGWALSGLATWWLWRSIYWSKLIGLRCKVSLAFDWIKEKAFGRDLSRF